MIRRPAATVAAPIEPERKDAGARTALKLQVAFELTSGGSHGRRLVGGARRACLELFRVGGGPR
ncbi:hypothetical protein EMGBD4_14750 [Verrucomicrobiota bacterium]|nr:hypothetical protein EMGBD4_14750 [Verrucomicrobiota bacterium]